VPAPAVVQIGLVNLISRPVVLDIPREQANVAQVLSLLHQPVTDKGEITLIKPGSGVQNITLDQAVEATLATGSVLVFDPATVNSGVLPRLPKTIRAEENIEAPGVTTSADAVSLQKTTRPTVPTAHAEPAGNPSLLVPRVTFPGTSDLGSPSLKPEPVDESPAARGIENTEPSTAVAGAADPHSESPDLQALPETSDEQRSESEPAAALARSAFSLPWLVILSGIGSCGLGLLLWSRFKRRAQPVATTSLPEPVPRHDNALELLISGTLAMVEEPLQLPYESAIFGRPLDTSPYRTDSAHALSGPHYIPQSSPSATEAVAVVEQQQQAPASTLAERKVRVDLRHPRSTTSVLDRALATFEGEQP